MKTNSLVPAVFVLALLLPPSAIAKPNLHFEANLGQVPDGVEFVSHGRGFTALLRPDALALTTRGAAAGYPTSLRMSLLGANARAASSGVGTEGVSHYLRGSNPEHWIRNVAHLSNVRYQQVYPGIDLVYYGRQGVLEFDFVAAPGSDPESITIALSHAAHVDQGALSIETPGGLLRFHHPISYQLVAGKRRLVESNYVRNEDGSFGFELGEYDPTRELIIDPMVEYCTYLGGNGTDEGFDIVVDAQGHAYVTGSTSSTNFVTSTGAYDEVGRVGGFSDPSDVFVTKLDPTGSSVIYSTYISGGGRDVGYGIDIDAQGNAYVVGTTDSVDDVLTIPDESFPLVGAIQPVYGGDTDLFVLKLNAAGSDLVYSTYYGGDQLERADSEQERPDIGVDSGGNAYVAGTTQSANFPTFNALPIAGPGPFALGINADGASLRYATFLGGDPFVFVWGVAVDYLGNSHIVGFTGDANLPTTAGVVQPVKGNVEDMFLYKLDSTGGLTWCTYFGGNDDDFAYGVDLDSDGNVYVTGSTVSTDYPVTNGPSPANAVAPLTKLNSDATAVLYSLILGGRQGNGVAVDRQGRANVVGVDGQDIFFVQVIASGAFWDFETFYGGLSSDVGNAIDVDAAGASYITGRTSSSSFPGEDVTNQNPLQGSLSSPPDGFVLKTPLDVPVAAPLPNAIAPARLRPNHPNPFNPRTNIQFDLARAGHVRLVVHDARGRQVAQLMDAWQEAGEQHVTWSGEKQASGVYRLVLDWTGSDGGRHRSSRPMVLAK